MDLILGHGKKDVINKIQDEEPFNVRDLKGFASAE